MPDHQPNNDSDHTTPSPPKGGPDEPRHNTTHPDRHQPDHDHDHSRHRPHEPDDAAITKTLITKLATIAIKFVTTHGPIAAFLRWVGNAINK